MPVWTFFLIFFGAILFLAMLPDFSIRKKESHPKESARSTTPTEPFPSESSHSQN
ncbi:hypothetical protein [Priestia koreensis]|uniref:hypothetical protein n=1 Tax=Priestia koreensis TaxID=284581 RepID=UPI0020423601|nr:hypothetical protein [Priestia koreensis]MCM3003095.1 hypothetical protein [Priestia koreensis]